MIKITGIYLENYQSIGEGTLIKLDSITVLVGPNSAGKSAVADALNAMMFNDPPEDGDIWPVMDSRFFTWPGPCIGLEFEIIDFPVFPGFSLETEDEVSFSFLKSLVGKKVFFSCCSHHTSLSVDGVELYNLEPASGFRSLEDLFMGHLDPKDYIIGSGNNCIDLEDNPLDSFTLIERLTVNADYDLLKDFWLHDLHPSSMSSHRSRRFGSGSEFEYEYGYRGTTNGFLLDFLFERKEDYFELYGTSWEDRYTGGDNKRTLDYMLTDFCEYGSHSTGGTWEELEPFVDKLNLSKTNRKKFKSEILGQRRRKHWKARWSSYLEYLGDVCSMLNATSGGLLRLISAELKYHHWHVKGDRGLLSSDRTVYSRTRKGELEAEAGADINIGRYCDQLDWVNRRSKDEEKYGTMYSRSYWHGEKDISFVADCFSDYLSSFQGYELYPNIVEKFSYGGHGEYLPAPEVNFLVDPSMGELEGWDISLRVRNPEGLDLGLEDIGSGLSYILPVITTLWASPFSLIEQPELHLHPKAQCEIADAFIAATKQDTQSIIETHSEYVILRLLRRIKETSAGYLLNENLKLSKDEMRIYYFDPDPEGFKTRIKEIRIDKQGELLNSWPGGFFSEREKELFSDE